MNRKTFKFLCDNFNREVNPELYEMWKEELLEYDDKLVEQAINQIIRTDKFMPTLSRIIEVIKEQPELYITEEEKLARWEKQGIHPSCMDKEIKHEELTEEELEELEREMAIFD